MSETCCYTSVLTRLVGGFLSIWPDVSTRTSPSEVLKLFDGLKAICNLIIQALCSFRQKLILPYTHLKITEQED